MTQETKKSTRTRILKKVSCRERAKILKKVSCREWRSSLAMHELAAQITQAADVIQAVEPIMGRPIELREEDDEPLVGDPAASDRERIISLLGPTPILLDDLIRMANASPAVVRTVLLELELAGRLERHGGGLVSLT